MSLTDAALRDLINQVSLSSAFGSIVIGELPPMARQQADNMLAEHMLLGVVRPILEGKAQACNSPRFLALPMAQLHRAARRFTCHATHMILFQYAYRFET